MTIDLRLGDCLDVMRGIPDASIDAVITDPPYGIDKAEWDSDVWEMLTKAGGECARILKPSGICFWFSSIRYLPETLKATSTIPYRWQFIWYASNNMQHGDLGFTKYTPCLVLSHSKAWRNMQDLRNVAIPSRKLDDVDHPTMKPLALMEYLVDKAIKEGQTILDPFMGSGTTGVACVKLNRNFIGIEISPDYYAIAQRRIAEAQAQLTMQLA